MGLKTTCKNACFSNKTEACVTKIPTFAKNTTAMTEPLQRKYPIGIQTFERIIKDGYVYVDKTDLVWKLAKNNTFAFLSRPRRFGKSLLTTTLASYFRGEKELFEGLKIMQFEQEWNSYPVIHVDMSGLKNKRSADDLVRSLNLTMSYNLGGDSFLEEEVTPGEKLAGYIKRTFTQTGKQVVVIIDEYDAPLLDVLHDDDRLPEYRRV